MSEHKVQYFKLLEKKYDIEEDIYKKLGDIQDLKKKMANENKKRAKDNKDREENLVKKAGFENQGVPDKALKSEVAAKKKEASIAERDYKLKELERKILKVEEDLEKLEFELKEAESDIRTHDSDEPTPVAGSSPLSSTVPLEASVLDDEDESDEDEPLTTTYQDYDE